MGIFGLIAATAVAFSGANHRVVIEVNVPGTTAYGTVLNNATNLCKALAPEPVQVEIVCHGEGLDMLLAAHNPLAKRIQQAQKSGITFSICQNTIKGRHVALNRLVPGVVVVPSGVAEVVRKQEAGWSYLKGAY